VISGRIQIELVGAARKMSQARGMERDNLGR